MANNSVQDLKRGNRIKKVIFGFLIATASFIILGPRVDTSFSLESSSKFPTDLEELQNFLYESENKLSELSPNAVKEIVWASKTPSKTEYSLVYLHGFTAMKTEVAPLTQIVAEQLKANVYYHRFPGHGRPPSALGKVKPNDWINSGYEALKIGSMIGKKPIVIATSNGGSIACVLACQKQTPELEALILISPNIQPQDPRADILLLPWGTKLAEAIAGEYQTWEFDNEEDKYHWTSPYPTKSAGAVLGVTKILREQDLSNFDTSTIIFVSPEDKIVNPDAIYNFYNKIESENKSLVEVFGSDDPADHVLAGDLKSPSTTNEISNHILQFVRGLDKN